MPDSIWQTMRWRQVQEAVTPEESRADAWCSIQFESPGLSMRQNGLCNRTPITNRYIEISLGSWPHDMLEIDDSVALNYTEHSKDMYISWWFRWIPP